MCLYPGSGEEDDFDPVVVAGKLRAIGDALDENARLVHVLTDLKKAAAKEVSGEKQRVFKESSPTHLELNTIPLTGFSGILPR